VSLQKGEPKMARIVPDPAPMRVSSKCGGTLIQGITTALYHYTLVMMQASNICGRPGIALNALSLCFQAIPDAKPVHTLA
jgi:hypothetical protein